MSIDLKQFTGHTPGPWIIIEDKWPFSYLNSSGKEGSGVHIEMRISTKRIHPQGKDHYPVVSMKFGIGKEAMVHIDETDARLIAAAPDLLAEVIRLRNELNYFNEGEPLSEEDQNAIDELGSDVFETKEVKLLREQLAVAVEALENVRDHHLGNESFTFVAKKYIDKIKQIGGE